MSFAVDLVVHTGSSALQRSVETSCQLTFLYCENTVLLLRLGLDTKNTWLGFANWFYHIRFGCHKYKHRSSRCLVKNIQCCCHSHGWKVSKTASTDLRTWKSWNAIFPPQPPLAPNMAISSCTGSLTVIHAVEMFI